MKNPHTLKLKTIPQRSKWRENDNVILHACFAMLVDCIEKQHIFDRHIDWSANAQSRKAKAEMETLYHWWKEYYKDEERFGMQCASIKKAPASKFSRYVDVDKDYKEEDKMLHRLIKIRRFLYV